jgi:hypothetical protein
MKAKILLLVLMVFLLENKVSAKQFPSIVVNQDTLVTINDLLELPILTEDFYHNVTFLNQDFDYDIINRANRLKMWSREVMTAGYVTLLGVIAVNSVLANNNNWSLWIDIPCATIIGMASMYPFILWSNHLKKKAESLSSQTVYLYNSHRLNLGATCFSNHHDHSLQAIGIGIKVNL